MRALFAIATALTLAASLVSASAAEPGAKHGLSLFGDLKYGPDFKHFDYVNPDAPKGGTLRLGVFSATFDTLNLYIIKGNPAAGLGDLFETLMTRAEDEPSSEYGLIAESAEVAPDKSWVVYTIRKEARFHDGSPITPDDVIWTFDTLRTKGRPQFRQYYAGVENVEKVGERGVKFSFKSNDNRELPQIIGEMPVLSKAYWTSHEFDKTTLEPPLGSGPYKIESVDPGRSITYRRVPDYWGADLPVNRGRHNFDVIVYDYYRDATIALEAFKAGRFDFRQENSSKDWATGYDGPALREGLIKKEEIPNEIPTGMQAFIYNTRHDIFKDPRVRHALSYAFDFAWSNKTLFYGAYTRTKSYFSNSELAATGLPSPDELKILEKYRGRIPDEVFTKEYQPPTYDGSGNIRDGLRTALHLLKEAGWSIKGRQLVNDKTGQPFEFEILLVNPQFERVVLPFKNNLERLGITARVRTVDSAQYQRRMDSFDFDMAVDSFGESLSPGNEQRYYWGSASADEQGSPNLIGVRDPVVDDLIELIVNAPDRPSLVTRTRCLDRVLLWSHYLIPNWHIQNFRVAYWVKLQRPAVNPKYGLPLDTWWLDPKSEQFVESRKKEVVKQ
jgi:microcin C transport system substrate-binding protein